MAYAILRARKLTTSAQMAGMQRHNTRTNNVSNADEDLTWLNKTYTQTGSKDLRKDIESRLEQSGVKVKSNSVKAIEYLMTASPEAFNFRKKRKDGKWAIYGNAKKWSAFEKKAMNWLEQRHGKENIVHVSIHFDEKTPHIHAYCTPIVHKEVKWKNSKGEGKSVKTSLSARDFLGGKEKMRAMQDSFAETMAPLDLERGKKGSNAKHEHIQKYYERVNKAHAIDKDMDDFVPKQPEMDIYEPSSPPLFGSKDDWKQKEQEKVKRLIHSKQFEAIRDFKANFEGEIEKAFESTRTTRYLRAKNSRLSDDLEKKTGEHAKTKKSLTDALNSLETKDENLKAWKHHIKNALVHKDPESIQTIMNALEKEEKKNIKGKNNEMRF